MIFVDSPVGALLAESLIVESRSTCGGSVLRQSRGRKPFSDIGIAQARALRRLRRIAEASSGSGGSLLVAQSKQLLHPATVRTGKGESGDLLG